MSTMSEEGLIFRRHKDWLESLIGVGFSSCTPASLSINDEKLADVLISKYDYLDSCISNDNFDNSLNSNLVLLLKFILENGPYLDSDINFKEQIDMFFTMFRNLLRNHLKDLPDSINLLILRLIEIRACRWQIKANIEEYYMRKVDQPSRHSCQPAVNALQYGFNMETQENMSCFVSSGLRTSKSYGDIVTNYKNDDAMFGRHKQLKLNSKAITKGEVVIKNSDSGKVMGIKGRRVHMIEEMSDTIISFQKVSPTARDRIVQISGQTKENINVAKNLIDATIKQNASPIPFNEFNDSGEIHSNNNHYPTGDLYGTHNHVTNAAKCSTQSSTRNPLSECDPSGHSIKLQVHDKKANITVSDKLLGEKLEQFLNKFNFADFIKSGLREEQMKPMTGANREVAAVAPCPEPEKPKPYITYDREFLLKFKTLNFTNASRVIEDIKMKQSHLYRF